MTTQASDPVSVAVVGAGFMGRLHASLLSQLRNATVHGVVDSDEAAARRLADQIGTRSATALDDLVEEAGRADAVVVATPEPDHRAATERAAALGSAVFVEKPIATTLEDADAMIEATGRAGVPLMVGHILRHESAYAALQQVVAEGRLGRLLSAYARRNAVIQEARRLAGRTSAVLYLAVHDVDVLLWLHSPRVRSVRAQAVSGRIAEEFGTPDAVWISARFEDGALAVVECGWALPAGWGGWSQGTAWQSFGDCRMDLTGTDDFVSLDMRSMNVVGVDQAGWRFPETRHWPVVNGRIAGAAAVQMGHFLDCVRTGGEPACDGQAGRRALEVCVAAEESLRRDEAEVAL
jgi:predicted dehydrogenase